MNQRSSFFKEIVDYLGQENIEDSERGIEPYRKNVTEYKKDIKGVIFPRCESDLLEIIQKASKYRISLYPISQGKNWGYGSKLPTSDGLIVIDFSRYMNKILHVNTQLGYVVIEPGVTQGQLSDYLLENGISYYIDVTGSARESSIIGNILDRGVGFNRKREDLVLSFRVLTGTGNFINTSHSEEIPYALLPSTCQPNINSLFIQSNFAIVTQAYIKILKRHDIVKVFNIIPKKTVNIVSLFSDLSLLHKLNYLDCIFHLYDSQRIGNISFPFIGKPEWFGVGNVKGSKRVVKAFQNEIKKILKKHGLVIFYTNKSVRFLRKIFPFWENILYLIESSVNIQQGHPKDTAVLESFGTTNPDLDGKKCLIFFVFSFQYDKANLFINTLEKLKANNTNIPIGVSLNLLDDIFIEAVINVEGDRSCQDEVENIQICSRNIIDSLISEGFYPYRLDIDNMDQIKRGKNYDVIKGVKKFLDPYNIISPQRY